MTVLTPAQQAVLHFTRSYIKEIGYPPTLREIADGVKLKSISSVHHHLRTLEDLGFIRRDLSRPRGLVILSQPGES